MQPPLRRILSTTLTVEVHPPGAKRTTTHHYLLPLNSQAYTLCVFAHTLMLCKEYSTEIGLFQDMVAFHKNWVVLTYLLSANCQISTSTALRDTALAAIGKGVLPDQTQYKVVQNTQKAYTLGTSYSCSDATKSNPTSIAA